MLMRNFLVEYEEGVVPEVSLANRKAIDGY